MKPACRWIDTPDAAYLHWHYACIATVKPQGDHFVTSIDWQDRTHVAQVATLAEGIHDVTEWVSAQEGLPFVSRRNVITWR
jgi:hypothetical protein